MRKRTDLMTIFLTLVAILGAICIPGSACATSAEEIEQEARRALRELYAESASAKALGQKAKGVLVFPGIVKGGFLVGGQYGEGALIKRGGAIEGYYSTLQVSYGLQVGLQKYGYALFFMSESSMSWLEKSDGWEVGVGPSIVIIDEGAASSMTSTTLQSDIYGFFFDQQGLMGGLGLQGTKITKMEK